MDRKFKINQSITDRQDASLGLYFRDVSKLSMINQEKEVELAKRIQQGDERAVEELVKANLRFVISVAKQYQGKGVPLVDLIQEGNLGLVESAKKYNPDKGIKFISYSVWWIRQAVIKAINDQCRTIRVPTSQIVNINKINKVNHKFEQLYERKPSIEELEDETNLKAKKINRALSAINKSISLESPLKDDDVCNLLDIIPNDNIETTDNLTTKNDLTNCIEYILGKLSYRDRDVVRMYFGIGINPMPNSEIAHRFGIGNERVRQILHKAIKYIKKNYSNSLKELM